MAVEERGEVVELYVMGGRLTGMEDELVEVDEMFMIGPPSRMEAVARAVMGAQTPVQLALKS